ncbi:MAG: Nif3-like dinuclear metal center hexameric protein [Clostridia bacterium]|nr:Nif3-like dinuclear metal center hexameric protein [Clostridia bacterium]
MKAYEIMNLLFSWAEAGTFERTCDTKKCGDENVEVKKVAVAMFGTLGVVKAAKEWGAELLVVHEPLYYTHMDEHTDEKIECAKRKIIEDSGLCIFRYHDYPHSAPTDLIADGMQANMGLEGETEYTDVFDLRRIHLTKPMSPREIALTLEKNLGIARVRICGALDEPCERVSCMFGTPGRVYEELRNDSCQVMLTGEGSEIGLGEYCRDAADLGFKKAVIFMGHIGSERDGMMLVADMINSRISGVEAKYFECGEVCRYSDSKA